MQEGLVAPGAAADDQDPASQGLDDVGAPEADLDVGEGAAGTPSEQMVELPSGKYTHAQIQGFIDTAGVLADEWGATPKPTEPPTPGGDGQGGFPREPGQQFPQQQAPPGQQFGQPPQQQHAGTQLARSLQEYGQQYGEPFGQLGEFVNEMVQTVPQLMQQTQQMQQQMQQAMKEAQQAMSAAGSVMTELEMVKLRNKYPDMTEEDQEQLLDGLDSRAKAGKPWMDFETGYRASKAHREREAQKATAAGAKKATQKARAQTQVGSGQEPPAPPRKAAKTVEEAIENERKQLGLT